LDFNITFFPALLHFVPTFGVIALAAGNSEIEISPITTIRNDFGTKQLL
jgi:hypothetical protein